MPLFLKKLINKKYFKAAVLLFTLYATFVIRAHGYERVPTANHLDEMLYAWSGIYLIETGSPVSWSTLDYPERAEVYKGKINYKGGLPETSVTLYKPWLDEPPLFSLLVGTFAHLNGVDRTEFIPASYIRIPLIFIAFASSIFIFLIARKLSGFWVGILSVITYGTVPLLVFASRTAMPENLIALMLLILVYLMLKFHEKNLFRYILPLPLIIGVAGLSKPTGYFLLPLALFFIFYILNEKKKLASAVRYCLYTIIITLPFVAAFFAYGLNFDKEIFWIINSIQSHRPVGFNSLSWWFIAPSYDTMEMRDSWYIFGMLAAVYYLLVPPVGIKKFVTISFVYWVMIVMISGGENDLLAWYRFPAFPFLAILTAWGLIEIVSKANFFSSFLAAGLLLGNRMLLVNAFRPNIDPLYYRLIFSSLMLPSTINLVFNRRNLEKLSRMVIVGIIVFGIYLNTLYIFNAFLVKCENLTCPIVPTTKLSTLHFPFFWRLFSLGEAKYK